MKWAEVWECLSFCRWVLVGMRTGKTILISLKTDMSMIPGGLASQLQPADVS